MIAVMDGTGLVADELYLLAHHEVTGKPLLERRPLSIGLAGGLLAELMLGGSISLRDDGAVMAHRAWPRDDLGRRVRDQIVAEQEPEPVREWLLFLARSAVGDVARRLEQSGHLMRVGRRVSWRPGRWVPVDDDWAVEAVLRVRVALDPSRPPASHEAVLAGLAVVCGLGFRFDECQKAAGGVEEAVGKLRLELQDLIAETRAAMQSPAIAVPTNDARLRRVLGIWRPS